MSKTRITAEPGMPQIVITREFAAVSAFTSTGDRDAMIASGMERGIRDSDDRLEELLAKLRAGETELS